MNVVFFVFNRPELTARVFEEIRRARPDRLLVVADGPRATHETDASRCAQVRQIVSHVDWPCEVLSNWSDVNLGCRQRVASGLNWVFEMVEEAIILEDDCLPSSTFFGYCQAMLERFRHDARIMHIGGSAIIKQPADYPYSYFFSRHLCIWGWATWRRAWQHYDVEMTRWPAFRSEGWVERLGLSAREEMDFEAAMQAVVSGKLDTWDAQWWFACWSQSGLSVHPSTNLISNLGFGADATHTHEVTPQAALELGQMSDLKHPPFVLADECSMPNGHRRLARKTIFGRLLPEDPPSWTEVSASLRRRFGR